MHDGESVVSCHKWLQYQYFNGERSQKVTSLLLIANDFFNAKIVLELWTEGILYLDLSFEYPQLYLSFSFENSSATSQLYRYRMTQIYKSDRQLAK